MNWTITSVRKALGDKLIGSSYMREMVCKTILHLPAEQIEQVCRKVWFISSPEDSWAFTFRGADIKDRHLVFLSEELFAQNTNQITYTILHELGHVILNHRNAIGVTQTQSEINRQEKEADDFSKKYITTSA
jgi:hypothetical protein